MARRRVDKPALSRGEKEKSLDPQFNAVAEAFLELFDLLEEYAPAWYAEQSHNRALGTYRMLQKSRGPQRNNELAARHDPKEREAVA